MSQATALHQVRVRQIRQEAEAIHSYELVPLLDQALPPFTAGAHIDVHLAAGLVRQYSLSNAPSERQRYVIAVLKEEQGRGGSKTLHETLHVGQVLNVSTPRNHFPLQARARKAILLAGGIGITPLKAMLHELQTLGRAYELHYCARQPDRLAFRDELAALQGQGGTGRVHFHLDGGQPSQGLDIAALLRTPEADTHVYYCGPSGFMAACQAATAHWPSGSVHCEHFKAPVTAGSELELAPPGGFSAQIASSGQIIQVAAEQTLVEALHFAGVPIETSCISGLCGTCRVGYLAGEVDHQDHILSEDEHLHCLTACVSRGKGGLLVLDL